MARIVCFDKNREDNLKLQRHIAKLDNSYHIKSCFDVLDLLTYLGNNEVDIVFLSASLDEINIEKLVKTLFKINGILRIILVSDKKEDAYYVVKHGLDGFLLKPIKIDDVKEILDNVKQGTLCKPQTVGSGAKEIRMHTMPVFEMFIDGKSVVFRGAKIKELLAYLVDADGGVVTTEMIVESLWEGEPFGQSQKVRCSVLVNSLKRFLRNLGIENLLVAERGQYHLNREVYTCDLDDIAARDSHAILRYDHRYLEEYEWGSRRKSFIEEIIFGNKKEY